MKLLQILHEFACGHYPINSQTEDPKALFNSLIKHLGEDAPLFQPLLDKRDDLYKPLRALRDALIAERGHYPRLVIASIADDELLPVRIDKVNRGYKISLLKNLQGRNQIPGIAPSAKQYEQFEVKATEEGTGVSQFS